MRQTILSIVGILILALAYFGMKKLGSQEDVQASSPTRSVPKVFVQKATKSDIPVHVNLTGRLEAVNKVDLYSETQGIFHSPKKFRPGTRFRRGQTIISINTSQEVANLKAQRSNLVNQIVRFLPDLKFDLPEAFQQWEKYIADFDLDESTPELPEPQSEREKFFIAGQGVHSIYYQIKNLESRLAKYRIYAPFSGILAQTFVNEGAMISPGQKLATFVGQSEFELVLPVREEYIPYLKTGQKLDLIDKEGGQKLEGSLLRISPIVDPATQTVDLYVKVTGQNLREGMFFEANLPLRPIKDAMEINRKLLVANQYVFGVEDGQLKPIDVEPVHYNQETVIIKGLKEGQPILRKMLPGAREGMNVEIIKE